MSLVIKWQPREGAVTTICFWNHRGVGILLLLVEAASSLVLVVENNDDDGHA